MQNRSEAPVRLKVLRTRLARLELKDRFYRNRFVVPNAVTLSSMFCGFLAIIYSTSGRFEKAVIAIALSILLDGLDGRVARRLKATSKFGVEFDSLSDFVSFGVAPAILMYNWSFRPVADEFGVLVSFIFALCSASRLARFNIQAENLKNFSGLPTPGAAAMVIAVVNSIPYAAPGQSKLIFDALLMLVLSFLMVSRIEFLSIKKAKMVGPRLFVVLGCTIGLLWYNSQIGVLALATVYVLSGPVSALMKISTKKPDGDSNDQAAVSI